MSHYLAKSNNLHTDFTIKLDEYHMQYATSMC